MKIDKINILNLDTLYKTICTLQNDANYKNYNFNNLYDQVLNQIVINFQLSEVNKFEYIFLKLFCNGNITQLENITIDKNYISNQYWDIYNDSIKPLMYLINDIENETNYDINKLNLYPISFYTGVVRVTLNGMNLGNIFSYYPNIFFIKATNNECRNDNNEFIEDYNIYKDEKISNYIIGEFYNKFYKFIIDNINNIDLPSNYYIEENFYNKLNNNKVLPSSIIDNKSIFIDLINDNMVEVNNRLKEYKKNNNIDIEDISISYIIESSISTFFDIINILPLECITARDNFLIPITKYKNKEYIPDCPIELENIYNIRFNQRINDIIDNSENIYKSDSDVLKRLSLLGGYVKYKYIINIPLDNIEIDDLENETKEILSIINKYNSIFYKFLNN